MTWAVSFQLPNSGRHIQPFCHSFHIFKRPQGTIRAQGYFQNPEVLLLLAGGQFLEGLKLPGNSHWGSLCVSRGLAVLRESRAPRVTWDLQEFQGFKVRPRHLHSPATRAPTPRASPWVDLARLQYKECPQSKVPSLVGSPRSPRNPMHSSIDTFRFSY